MHTMAIHAKVRRMRFRDGLSISEIARRTSLSRKTIKGWPREPVRSELAYRRPAGPRKLDAHVAWLRRCWRPAPVTCARSGSRRCGSISNRRPGASPEATAG